MLCWVAEDSDFVLLIISKWCPSFQEFVLMGPWPSQWNSKKLAKWILERELNWLFKDMLCWVAEDSDFVLLIISKWCPSFQEFVLMGPWPSQWNSKKLAKWILERELNWLFKDMLCWVAEDSDFVLLIISKWCPSFHGHHNKIQRNLPNVPPSTYC